MQDSLYLVGDGDEMDVLHDVQKAFGISISDREAEATLTVGELYDLIEAKSPERAEQCLSQIAFYRLRRAIRSVLRGDAVTPDTPISIVHTTGASVGSVWSRLSEKSGLKLPPLETRFGPLRASVAASRKLCLLNWIILAALAGAILAFLKIKIGDVLWGLLGLFLGYQIVRYGIYLRYGEIPRRIVTVGDLAREAAGYSFSELRRNQHSCSRHDRWDALVAILRQISGHKAVIGRDTTFIARS